MEVLQPAELMRPLPRHIIPPPTPRRLTAQVRSRLNRTYTKYQVEVPASRQDSESDGQSGG